MSKKKNIKKESAKEPSDARKKLFWMVTILIPVLVIVLTEVGLRLAEYGGNTELFIEGPPGYENYLRCNPNVARRYFYMESSVPTPPKQLFLKDKTENSFRIFVLGGSSAAGFPYGNNVSFPNVLERGLAKTFPDKNIEVINIAMAAVNSYTLLDLMDEVLDQLPDALLIYAGHNEYYGALGIGSVQSLGSWRGMINTYLRLQSFRTFILLRDFIGWVRIGLGGLFADNEAVDPSATLMSRIVSEQTIPFESDLYKIGKAQFEGNMNDILLKASDRGVKVILSELVSNLRDQKPFISVSNDNGQTAGQLYTSAKTSEAAGKYEKARESYILAKDFDGLRFRAPEEFNTVLHKLGEKYSCPVVRLVSEFENESTNGLIGESLILEHLHPNIDGYYLLAKSFYKTLAENKMIGNGWNADLMQTVYSEGKTELDSVFGAVVIKQLKQSWPFRPKGEENNFLRTFRPKNKLEEIAFKVISTPDYNIQSGHMELGGFYESNNEPVKSVDEYKALIASIPHEIEFYRKAAIVLIREKLFDEADSLLRSSLKYRGDYFVNKWIGQIALMNEDYKEAIKFLKESDLVDQQVVFNLSRAYYSDGQLEKGEENFVRLKNMSRNSDYVKYLTKVRTMAFMKKKIKLPQ